MIRYTVTYTRAALNALADEWLNAADRNAVTAAGDEIDRQLSTDALSKGVEEREGLRKLVVNPVQVQFTVDDDDRIVTIWTVRLVNDLSGDT